MIKIRVEIAVNKNVGEEEEIMSELAVLLEHENYNVIDIVAWEDEDDE